MKVIPWLIAGVGLGAAIVYLLSPQPEYATGYDAVEGAARKTSQWGTKQRFAGKGQSIAGAFKEGVGRFSGDPDLRDEGSVDRLVGEAKNAAGKLGEAAGQTLHDLNI